MRAFNRMNPNGRLYTLVEQHDGTTLIRRRASGREIIVPHHILRVEEAWPRIARGERGC